MTATQKPERAREAGRRRAALRARAGPHRVDAVDLPGRARRHDHRHRGALDRPRPGRLLAVPLAVLHLPADPGRHHAALRQAGRRPRASTGAVLRHRGVPGRLGPLRRRVEHAGPDHRPGDPGHRRRRGAADDGHGRRGPVLRGGAGPRAGLRGERVGCGRGRRSDPGRVVLGVPELAVDLLHQHPARWRRRLDAVAALPRAGGEDPAPARPRRVRRCSPPGSRCSSWGCSRAASRGTGARR